MYLIEETRLCPLNSLPPERFMRGLLYGDGLFESIYYHNSKLYFYEAHINRLKRGMAILGLNADLPSESQIHRFLVTLQKEEDTLRIRLLLVREPGGLYTPTSEKAMVVLHIESSPAFQIITDVSAGISVHAQLAPHALSFCKTLNAIPYIMAGRERAANGWGEILLTQSSKNELAAAGSGNVIAFNHNKKEFIMPGNDAGVAAGIMRGMLEIYFVSKGYIVIDTSLKAEQLAELELASCNSFSVKFISTIDKEVHTTTHVKPLIQEALSSYGLI